MVARLDAAADPSRSRDPAINTVTAISGVIDAGQQWSFLWQEAGNNGDGIVGTDDGGLLIAQNDKSRVVNSKPMERRR